MPGTPKKNGTKRPAARKTAKRGSARSSSVTKSTPPQPGRNRSTSERIALAKREWETTVDALPQLVCLLDQDGRIVRANRVVESWRLGSVESVKHKGLHDLFCPHCSARNCRILATWTQMYAQLGTHATVSEESDDLIPGRSLRIQLRSIPSAGRTRRRGMASGAIMVIEDITDQKCAEAILRDANKMLAEQVRQRTSEVEDINARLRREFDEHRVVKAVLMRSEERYFDEHRIVKAELMRSEERYRGLIDTMSEGLIVTDPDGQVVYVNDSFCHILGHSRAALIDRGPDDLALTKILCAESELTHEPSQSSTFERSFLRKDGVPVTIHVSQQRIFDHDGHYDGCFAVIMDVTERHRSEEALRRSESEMRLLSAQLLAAQEQERKRIASELHDGISQTMSAVKFYLESTAALCRNGQTPPLADAIDKIVPKVQAAIDEVHRISMALRPSTLDDLGILATLSWFCREFQGIYEQLKLELTVSVTEDEIAAPIKTMIYRIVQEALNNVVKHANAQRVSVQLSCANNSIELVISDDGTGFSLEEVAQRETRHGIGLSSMRERAESTGAVFQCVSRAPRGTCIQVSWPHPARRSNNAVILDKANDK